MVDEIEVKMYSSCNNHASVTLGITSWRRILNRKQEKNCIVLR